MPRPSLSRPPRLSTMPSPDVENEPPTAYNIRRHPTNRKLFFTPQSKTSAASPTHLLTRDSITRRFYRQHEDKTPIKTPLPRRPSNVPSTTRRPKITTLDATPSINRSLRGSAPDRWRARQSADLSAWLNHELAPGSDAASLPFHHVASSVVYLNQFAGLNTLYRSRLVHSVLGRITNEICAGRLGVSKSIKLATFIKERDELISLLLLNYHPHWLLLVLSVVLGVNLAVALDEAVEIAGTGGRSFNHEQVLMQTLENALRDDFLADAPSDDIASREKVSPTGKARDRYNALILRRALVVIYLLDVAKRQRDPIIKPDPPLFRATSNMTSSVDMLRELQKLLLNDHGDIVRFLHQRGYQVSYKSPVYEPFGNLRIANLGEDMRDGTRLCKLASIMRRDHHILTQVMRIGPGHRPSMALAIKKQNISSALNLMKECLPENMQAKFQWHATPHDIAAGNLEKTIAVLWQIAALWMEYVVVDVNNLREELGVIQDQFRMARRNPNSPSNNVQPDLTHLADSPSKLQIIESCTTDSGDLLLKWCATLCGIYGVEIRDFTEDFRDGAVLCLILHHYCPSLMRIDEINRIPAGDQRGAFAAEAEHKHVQKNLDLFMDRCRLLGTLPEIYLSAEATLAPAFRDSLKEDSVGRVMQLLASYLFRRMMMQKETANARREVFEMLENNRLTPELETSDDIDPMHERENVVANKQISVDSFPQENSEYTDKRYSAGSGNADDSAIDESRGHEMTASDNLGSEQLLTGKTGDLAHVYTRMRHVQSRRATRPRGSQMISDRENAARTILRHYRGYKARQEYIRLKEAVVDLQSCFRGFLGRREILQFREAQTEDLLPPNDPVEHQTESLHPLVAGTAEQLMAPAEEPAGIIHENTRSLPVRIGRHILEFLPAIRRHMSVMESYSQRMLAHERVQDQNQAATAIQSGARFYLARRTRSLLETQKEETRKTWLACAFETAKTAVRIAEEQRRELVRWRETIFTNALNQAAKAFDAEMLRAEKSRDEEILQRQRYEETKAVQEEKFASEQRELKEAFEGELANIHQQIKALQTRASGMELSSNSSLCDQHDGIIESLEQSSIRNDIQDDALRLIYGDLNNERERADKLESELRNVRDKDRETREDILQLHKAWQDRFQGLEDEIQQSYGTLLTGAICIATSQYRLHMDTLANTRSKEENEREEWETQMQQGHVAFDHAEKEAIRNLTNDLSQFDENADRLMIAVANQETWMNEQDIQEARTEKYQRMLEEDLDFVCVKSEEEDIKWNASSKEFDVEAEEISLGIDEFEKCKRETDSQTEALDIEIRALHDLKQRQDMEDHLLRVIELAMEKFDVEMSERHEENENNMYCRHEIDTELQLEDQEEVLEAEEFENDMEVIEKNIDMLESECAHSDEHLGLLDSYIAHLFSESPSIMVYDDIPDIPGDELSEDVEECIALHRVTCQLMEELYLDESDDDQALGGNNAPYDHSPEEASPAQTRDLTGGTGSWEEQEVTVSEYGNNVSDYNSDMESITQQVSSRTGAGLYDRLVDEEVEYYNGKPTRDIGVQTGSGPNTPFSSPDPYPHSDLKSPYLSDSGFYDSENEASSDEGQGETSSCDNTLSLSHTSQLNQIASFEETPANHRQDSSGVFCPYVEVNAPPSHLYPSETHRESLSNETPHTESNVIYPSPGPLDTLAQLALQDALDSNVLVDGFKYHLDAQESQAHLLGSIENNSRTSKLEEKENLQVHSNSSTSKGGPLKIYGLRRESAIGNLTSPFYPEDTEPVEVDGEDGDVLGSQSESVNHSSDDDVSSSHDDISIAESKRKAIAQSDIPADLGDLSVELNGFNIQPHRLSVERVTQDPSSANKLASVMRRISIAASSPHVGSEAAMATLEERQAPHRDIVRTIFILMRYCSRSGDQLKLRELGISILCDFCTVHRRTAEVMEAEECIDVLTTCVQYHRDQDTIFYPTVRVLWEIALQPGGKEMIIGNQDCVTRLQSVNEILGLQALREQRNLERIRQANMIVDIVRKRRTEGGSLRSMTEALRSAKDRKLNSALPRKDSHRLLCDLVEIISA